MKLDLTSFAFGFKIADSAGNPNWATSLGQGARYKINEDGTTCELLKGLVYSSIPLSSVETRIGKGGRLYRCDDPLAAVVLASCFTKVYVNGALVDRCRMILLLTRDTSKSHEGRLRLKYTPHNTLVDATGKALFSNVESFSLIRKSLGLAESACWFVYDLNIKDQDALHLSVAVAKKSGCASYESTISLHKKWLSLISVDDAMKQGAVEGANSGGNEALSEPPIDVNRLSVALKLFQRQRAGSGGLGSEPSAEAVRQEFIDWCVKVDGKAKATPLTYLPPLVSVSKPMEAESMKSSWNGVYEFVFGKKPAKHVLEITSAAELDEVYGDLLKVYEVKDVPMPERTNAANWNKVRAWVKADKAKGSDAVIIHASAFAKYRKFLEWRAANGGAERGGPNGWASYDAWAKAARETFAKVDAGMLIAADFDYAGFARKFVYNPTVANVYFKNHDANEKTEVGNFISQNRQTPKAASWYIEKDNLPKVKGLKSGVALNFMMKVRPAEFATYSPMIDKTLMSVGLLAKPLPDEPTVESYEQSKALQGQVLAKMHELHIGKAADDESAADYLTVNEFAWWLSDEKNQNLIKEKVMESKMKDAAPTLMEDGKRKDLKFDPEKLDDVLLLRLLASLRAKGFAILAGHSGTGKSRYVKKLAYMTCNVEELRKEGELPGNYLILQVKPNWHDSTELLGFRNAMDGNRYQKTSLIEFLFKAYHYKDTPFFLCLDEMNLAPVEQYFAEFLSAMESEEPVALNDIKADESNLFELGCEYKDAREYLSKNGFSIPKNLFIVGTVNMDETTNQFSRKVLDRAFTIEMTDVDFTKFGSVEKPSYSDTLKEQYVKELLGGVFAADKLDEDDTKEGSPLVKVQKALAETPFAIAYRFASEYTLLKRALAVFDDGEKKIGLDPFDQAALMKILPRIAGEADYIRKVYGEEGKDGLRKALEGKKVSLEKIKTILKRAKDTNAQYITFWP